MPTIRQKIKHEVNWSVFINFNFKCIKNSFKDIGVGEIKSPVVPAFIVGCGHSGTTLLASRLGLSSNIYLIPKETSAYLLGNSLKKTRAIVNLALDQAKAAGCLVMLEKTPKHVYCYDRIRRLHPSARFICIVRNPLDNIASLYRRFNDINLSCERYIYDNTTLWELQRNESCLLLRYEDLTEKPEETLASTIKWLGCPWEQSVLGTNVIFQLKKDSKENQVRRYSQVAKPIHPNSGGYKNIFSPQQTAFVLSKTTGIARLLGYEYIDESRPTQ